MDQVTKILREVEAALAGNPAVLHAQTEFAAAEKVLHKLTSHTKSLELDVKSVEEKIKEVDERLYSGSVRSPKELLDLQRDLEMHKRHHAELNEVLWQAMLEMDEAQGDAARCKESLAEATRHWDSDCVGLRRQQAELMDRINADTERRNAILPVIPPADMKLYATLRVKKSNGVAVAPVKGKACSQCGESPSSMELQQARGDLLVMCPNCGRILYSV